MVTRVVVVLFLLTALAPAMFVVGRVTAQRECAAVVPSVTSSLPGVLVRVRVPAFTPKSAVIVSECSLDGTTWFSARSNGTCYYVDAPR